MIQHAATTNIERYSLAEMSDVYWVYSGSLCAQKHYDQALQVLEKVWGRIETEALEHHTSQPIHPPTLEERELTELNVALSTPKTLLKGDANERDLQHRAED